jgi:hypothetical protein
MQIHDKGKKARWKGREGPISLLEGKEAKMRI